MVEKSGYLDAEWREPRMLRKKIIDAVSEYRPAGGIVECAMQVLHGGMEIFFRSGGTKPAKIPVGVSERPPPFRQQPGPKIDVDDVGKHQGSKSAICRESPRNRTRVNKRRRDVRPQYAQTPPR